jgi:hypothetical protein
MPKLHIARFSAEITPPVGHPLCGGWIEPARDVVDPLRAIGVVLLGMGQPVVLCALDWCETRNDAYDAWRAALADAAHTAADHVAVHCVHPHDAPIADLAAERLLEAAPDGPPSLDLEFFRRAVNGTAEALRKSLGATEPFDQIGVGQAKVEQVASSRRVLGPNGKVKYIRYSATKDPEIRAAPEGLIDPWLKTLSFWNGTKPLAALNYYTVHPMSYYGNGHVSSDFCGLARQKRQDEAGDVLQIYFTGCAGNITAGKYNDGARENRPVLRDRVYDAMKAAWERTERSSIEGWEWRVIPLTLQPRTEPSFGAKASKRVLADRTQPKARRGNAALQLSWLERIDKPIELSCLELGNVSILHLPGEPFVEYQLAAQAMRKGRFVCVAGYGDGGPGYIPTAQAFEEGGYEPTVALAAPESEEILLRAMRKLLV